VKELAFRVRFRHASLLAAKIVFGTGIVFYVAAVLLNSDNLILCGFACELLAVVFCLLSLLGRSS